MTAQSYAPISRPFDPNWFAIEYFYLGLVRDVPDRIDKLASYIPKSASEEFAKLIHFGSFLMAGYQTPYENIKSAVYKSFSTAAEQYAKIVARRESSWMSKLPELQLLALFTQFLRRGYAYDFFRPALVDARLQAELEPDMEASEQVALIFLIDAVLCELGDASAFQALVDRREAQMSWTIRLGISNAAADVQFVNSATKVVSKKLEKSLKNNRGIYPYIAALEATPLDERKDLDMKPRVKGKDT